jgi:hypothetical protein
MRAAFNSAGKGVLVWEENSGMSSRVLWAYFDGAVMQPEVELASYASQPSVATNGTDFMLVWNAGRIKAVICSSSGVLGSPVIISDWNVDTLDIASNNSGYAVAWRKNDNVSGQQRIFANIYSASSWATEIIVDTVSGHGYYPRIASNGSGYVVVWHKYTAIGNYDIYAAVNSGGTSTWTAPAPLENQSGSAVYPNIASSGTGYAVAWAQDDGFGSYDVYANIYSAGTWSSAGTLLENSSYALYSASNVEIAASGSGYGVVWVQADGSNYSAHANIYSGGSWTTAAVVDMSPAGAALKVDIASNGSGYAVVWQQSDAPGQNSVYANLFSAGTWTTPVRLDAGASSAQDPLAVRFLSGYAVAWHQDDVSGNPNLFGTINPGAGWSAPTTPLVQSIWRGTGFKPNMATNRNGVSLAAWTEQHKGQNRLVGSINANGVWGAPFLIDDNTYNETAVATNGTTFMILWYSNGQGVPMAIICSGSGTLGTAEKVGPATGSYATSPSLASNGSGYAAIWSRWDYSGVSEQNIYANVYSNGSWMKDGGGNPTPWVLENSMSYAYTPVIASNGSGYGAAWVQHDATVYSVYANIFSAGTWSTGGTLIENGSFDASSPAIASNGSGYAVAWYQYDGVANYDIFANVYSGGTWSTGGTLLEKFNTQADAPSIASNGSGYAVVWDQYDGSYFSIYANIFSSGTWSTGATLLEHIDSYASAPSIASNGSGYAASWFQYDGSNNSVYRNIYSSGSWSMGGTLLETNSGDADTTKIISNGNKYSVIWWQQDPADPLVFDIWARLGI